jgi:hypothetical protein
VAREDREQGIAVARPCELRAVHDDRIDVVCVRDEIELTRYR